jgi:hypothetical protein
VFNAAVLGNLIQSEINIIYVGQLFMIINYLRGD